MNIQVRVVRITMPPQYYKPGIHQSLERAILRQLVQYGSIEAAIEDGWLQEIRSAGEKNPGRRFMIYLSDKKRYHDIPISFSFSINGKIVE